ncbi:MAG: nickel-dependent lactate racemase [Acidobacteria bacterium]|nr:nickel-dependent lactate racemase [Acidobacteriota bacterium]
MYTNWRKKGSMDYFLNYSGDKLHFKVPPEWKVLSSSDCAKAPVVEDVVKEIERALDNPLGMPSLEAYARPGMKVAVLFDDTQRATPANLAIPAILNRLNKAGVDDERIYAICARGTHPKPTDEQIEKKVGEEVMKRLRGRISIHEAQSSDNVLVGRTHWGTAVEINRHVMESDLVIGIGTCIPHPYSGYGGGCKIIMPGVCSYDTISAHHYNWLRNKDSQLNKLEGNPWFEESVEIARLAGLTYKLDFLLNETNKVIGAFFGDPVEAHRQGAYHATSLYLVNLPKQADVVITSASPLEIGVQATKALLNARLAVRAGGTIIWVAAQKQAGPLMSLIDQMAAAKSANEYHHRLLRGDIPESIRPFGISFFMLGVPFKELSEKYRVIHVTEGLTKEQVTLMDFEYAATIDEAIQSAQKEMPQADVTILPSGGTIIPTIK